MIKNIFNQNKILEEIEKIRNNGGSAQDILDKLEQIDSNKFPLDIMNYQHWIAEFLLKKILNNRNLIGKNIKLYRKEFPNTLIEINSIIEAIRIRNLVSHEGLSRNHIKVHTALKTYSLYIKFIASESNIDLNSILLPPYIDYLKESSTEECELEEVSKKNFKYWSVPVVILFSIIYYLNIHSIIFLAGTEDGTYYKIAQELKDRYEDDIEVEPSKGSVENLKTLGLKKVMGFGLIQEDVIKKFAKEAIEGKELQKKILKNIYLLRPMLKEEIHILVRDDSNMSYFQDIKNREISIGSEKSGNAITAQSIYKKLFGKTLENQKYYQDFSDSLYALQHKEVDAVIIVGGEPLLKLQKPIKGIKLLSYKKSKTLTGYEIGNIEKDSYPWLKSDKSTLMVKSFLVTNISDKRDIAFLPILDSLKKSLESSDNSDIHPKLKEFAKLNCLPTLPNGVIYHSATRLDKYCKNEK